MLFEHKSVPPGFCDSAITDLIAKSSKLRHFRKSSQIFGIADFGCPVISSQHAFCQRKVVSQFEKWNEQPCVLIMPDLQELHWKNEPKAERIRATLLGYAVQTVYLLGPEAAQAAGCSRSRDIVMYSAGRYSEESSRIHSRINNISVKSCEKHWNSAQNSVKAVYIRTNATDVENRKNIVQ